MGGEGGTETDDERALRVGAVVRLGERERERLHIAAVSVGGVTGGAQEGVTTPDQTDCPNDRPRNERHAKLGDFSVSFIG